MSSESDSEGLEAFVQKQQEIVEKKYINASDIEDNDYVEDFVTDNSSSSDYESSDTHNSEHKIFTDSSSHEVSKEDALINLSCKIRNKKLNKADKSRNVKKDLTKKEESDDSEIRTISSKMNRSYSDDKSTENLKTIVTKNVSVVLEDIKDKCDEATLKSIKKCNTSDASSGGKRKIFNESDSDSSIDLKHIPRNRQKVIKEHFKIQSNLNSSDDLFSDITGSDDESFNCSLTKKEDILKTPVPKTPMNSNVIKSQSNILKTPINQNIMQTPINQNVKSNFKTPRTQILKKNKFTTPQTKRAIKFLKENDVDYKESSLSDNYLSDNSDDSFIVDDDDDDENYIFSDDNFDKPKINQFSTPKYNKKDNLINQKLIKTEPRKCNLPKFDFITSLMNNVDDNRRDNEAINYRKKFKTLKEELSRKIFTIYNENAFENKFNYHIEIQWSKTLTKTAGRCISSRKSNKWTVKCIELSTKVLTDTERLLKTLVHEMCHALVTIVYKNSNPTQQYQHHGIHWKYFTIKAHQAYPQVPVATCCHDYKIETKYEYWCLKCNKVIKRHSKSIDINKKVCGKCRGNFTLYMNKSDGTKIVVNDASVKLNSYAEFVKKNYSYFRTPGKSHGEAMKEMSSAYKLEKEQPQKNNREIDESSIDELSKKLKQVALDQAKRKKSILSNETSESENEFKLPSDNLIRITKLPDRDYMDDVLSIIDSTKHIDDCTLKDDDDSDDGYVDQKSDKRKKLIDLTKIFL